MLSIALSPEDRLRSLSASDVMNRKVSSIPSRYSMELAGAALVQAGVSGAPVVDDEGRCVGVLTATDFLRIGRCAAGTSDQDRESGGLSREGDASAGRVADNMSVAQTVTPDTPLLKAVEVMCAAHIHRLIVLDERAVPVGIVSTLDVMAALSAALYEGRHECCSPTEKVRGAP
jgi:CBS-domain-containing membrane protein